LALAFSLLFFLVKAAKKPATALLQKKFKFKIHNDTLDYNQRMLFKQQDTTGRWPAKPVSVGG
jgi:hypothetical protein